MKLLLQGVRLILIALVLAAQLAWAQEPAWAEDPVQPAPVAAVVDSVAAPAESSGFRLKSEPVRGESGSMAAATAQMVLGLAAVLGVIFGLAWLARRFNLNVAGASGSLRVVSAMTVGPKEKILVVEVEDKRLLLGVTSQQITLLQVLEGEAPNPVTSAASAGGFAEKMQALLKSGTLHEK